MLKGCRLLLRRLNIYRKEKKKSSRAFCKSSRGFEKSSRGFPEAFSWRVLKVK